MPTGISNHTMNYPITKGHTQSHLLRKPGRRHSVPTAGCRQTDCFCSVSGAAVQGRRGPCGSPQASLSGIRWPLRKWVSQRWWPSMLAWRPHVPNRKWYVIIQQSQTLFPEFLWKTYTQFCKVGTQREALTYSIKSGIPSSQFLPVPHQAYQTEATFTKCC